MDETRPWPVDGYDDRREKLAAIEAELAEHPGTLARARWNEVVRSHSVWARNIRELDELVSAGESQEDLMVELIQNVRAPTIRNEFFAQMDQRLHNMLASVVSLVDITRKFLQSYPETDFAIAFESRNLIIREAPATEFIRRFRNYLLHYGHAPFELAGMLTGSSEMTMEITISRAALLEWTGWTAPARAFVEECSEGIKLRSVIGEYSTKLEALYAWTFVQFEDLHGDDIDAVNELIQQRNLILSGGALDGRDLESFFTKLQENLQSNSSEHGGANAVPPEL